MDATHTTDDEQTRLWNGSAGHAWVDAQEALDRMFKPFENLLVEELRVGSRSRILDVGCGAGGTTLAVARLLGAEGDATGVDISEPMIAAARARAGREGLPARFVRADAEHYGFEPASFDAIVSRFGVMFFEDPARAFANLRRAARAGAVLRFVAWRSAEENPFMTTAERAAAPLLPDLPARRDDEPGQFGLASGERVRSILERSGWEEVEVRPIDVVCTLPERELATYLARLGPVGRALDEADEGTRARVVDTVRAAFSPYVHGAEVRYSAACWMVRARAGSSARRPRVGE
jgi:SAM-dependent methyltransferase